MYFYKISISILLVLYKLSSGLITDKKDIN